MIDATLFDRFVGANYAHVADEIKALAETLDIVIVPWPESVDLTAVDGMGLAILDSDISQIITKFEFPPE